MKELFLINKEINDYEHIIIYGCGFTGKKMLYKLLQHNVKVKCFADSNPDICGNSYLNIPIIHIDEINDLNESTAVVVTGRYITTVAKELEKRGFEHLFFDYGNEANIIHLEREENT